MILKQHSSETVSAYLRESHADLHGIHKDSAVLVTSGRTMPPSIYSIALPGKWPIRRVLLLHIGILESQGTIFEEE